MRWILCIWRWNKFSSLLFFFFVIKNIVTLNYNRYKLLIFSQKNRRAFKHARRLVYTLYIHICIIKKRKAKKKTKDGRPNAPSPSCPGWLEHPKIPQSRAGRLDQQEVGSLLLPLHRLRVWGGAIKFYLFIYILFEITYEFRRKMVQVNIDR